LTPTRAMAPLPFELWWVWCSVTFSDLWSHRCHGSKKNSCHSFSLWPPWTAEKTSLSNHVLWPHGSTDQVLHFRV
jgi:hypothetical protein